MSETMESADPGDDVPDVRLYVTDALEWQTRVKHDSEKQYCYQKNPGEEFFHLIVNGEIYLARGDEKYCLRCALRDGIVTPDRLFWQHRMKPKKSSPM
jgi:hypothetical protein